MAIKLYGAVGSSPTFRALAALIEKDLDFEFIPVDYAGREHKSPEFLQRNPFGQIPVFEDGDLKVFESRAITKYVAEAYADKGTDMTNNEPKKLAIQMVWMEVESQKFEPASARLVWELALKPILGLETDDGVVPEFEEKLTQVLDVYEQRLTESKYLGGDIFTLADLHHLPNVHYLMGTKAKSLFHARPHVSAWASDILSRPAWVKVASMLAQLANKHIF
ncbi:glutathione S-transferase-like [Cynara cardunculus var. scolymus]|uniref:glutathione S-transferase-like n=1 Tax=Cynara cardunculus var. scolymus TaxID=59895 RepID=UPI000D630D32|nr:glutathione S-transferase-like [Cynara cardunculus var. scolymus]